MAARAPWVASIAIAIWASPLHHLGGDLAAAAAAVRLLLLLRLQLALKVVVVLVLALRQQQQPGRRVASEELQRR